MHTYRTLVLTLARSTLREPVGLFFTLIFAPLLVVILGLIFGNDPKPEFGHQGFVDATLPAFTSAGGDHGCDDTAGESATTPGERCPDVTVGNTASPAYLRCRRPHSQLSHRPDRHHPRPRGGDGGVRCVTGG